MKQYCISYFLDLLADSTHPKGQFSSYCKYNSIEDACAELAFVFNDGETTASARDFFTNGQVGDVYAEDDDYRLMIKEYSK